METNFNNTAPEKPLKKRAGIALVWFFAAMLALNYLSRAISESLKAEVRTGYASAGTLDESVEGTGTWAADETRFYTTYYTRRIIQVYVRPGQTISVGDPLFAYDVSTVKGGKKVSEKKVYAAEQAVKKAEAELENAEDPLYAQSVLESARQALEYAKFTYAQTHAIQNGGVVCASFSGTLIKCDLSTGKPSSAGSTGFEVAPEGVAFTMTVTVKEAERIAVGDLVALYDNGKEEEETISVAEIHSPDAEDNVSVVCTGNGGKDRLAGAKQDYKIKKLSDRFQTCIPISALRQSGPEQYYVLMLTEEETILGKQLTATMQQVKLIARDQQRAAIEASISEQDRLITKSSKELKDGDYVVLQDA